MEFVNCTDHEVNIMNEDGSILRSFPPSGNIARINLGFQDVSVDGLPCQLISYEDIVGIPTPKEGTLFIVSSMVMQSSPRKDLISPRIHHRPIKDAHGNIIGVRSFMMRR